MRSDYSQLAANRFKYNGKEEQVTGDLKYLDYGARMYDCGVGRWFGMDPKAEKFYGMSPYCYVLNNLLLLIDPDGELPVVAIPVGGAFVIIGVMDMVAIGLGLVTSGVVLQNAFDRYNIEFTEDVADYWTTVLTSMSLIYVEEYRQNKEKEWQDRKDREAKDIWEQTLVNGQKSIEANFPTPTPDGNIDPDFNNKLNFTQKLILTSALIITAYQSCDENSQVSSVKETFRQNEKYSFWEAVKILWFGKSNNKNSK